MVLEHVFLYVCTKKKWKTCNFLQIYEVDTNMTFIHKSYFIRKKAIKNYLLHMKTQISQKMDMQYLCNKSPRYKLKICIYIV